MNTQLGLFYKIYDHKTKILIINTWVLQLCQNQELIECHLITYNNYYTNLKNVIIDYNNIFLKNGYRIL